MKKTVITAAAEIKNWYLFTEFLALDNKHYNIVPQTCTINFCCRLFSIFSCSICRQKSLSFMAVSFCSCWISFSSSLYTSQVYYKVTHICTSAKCTTRLLTSVHQPSVLQGYSHLHTSQVYYKVTHICTSVHQPSVLQSYSHLHTSQVYYKVKPGFHYLSWRPELTGDRFPVNTGNGNQSPVNSGRQLG